MRETKSWLRGVLIASIVIVAVLGVTYTSYGSCSGIKYHYFETAACINKIGTQIFNCPGYPEEDDAYHQSPFYVTEIIDCSCTGGSGPIEEGDEDPP